MYHLGSHPLNRRTFKHIKYEIMTYKSLEEKWEYLITAYAVV